MPPDTAIDAALRFRLRLLKQEREAAVRLVNAYGMAYERLQPQIRALTAELEAMAAAGELKPWKVGRLSQLRSLRESIEAEINRFAIIAENEVGLGARAAIEASQAETKALARAALPGIEAVDARIMARWQGLNPEAVQSLLGFLSPDSPAMSALRDKLGSAMAQTAADALVEGTALGYGPRRTAAIMRRSLGSGLSWSLRTARTMQLYAYREGSRASYLANPAIVPGWRWMSARDDRTCAACLAMDGQEFTPKDRLNGHYQCRCVMVPLTVSYRDLGLDVDEPESGLQYATGEDWLKAQDAGLQRKTLGKTRFEAFEKGELQFDKLAVEKEDPTFGLMRNLSKVGEAT